MRRDYCRIIAAVIIVLAGSVCAQTYPSKPIRLIVPFSPGGGVDFTARVVGQKLGEAYGQPVVADNRAGAAGVIGTELVAKAAPDGYTLLLGSAGPLAILPGVSARLPYDPVRDFAPITLVSSMPFVLVVHPSLAVRSVQDLIALARAKPGQLNYASPGSGSTTHLATELFKALAKVDIVHVPYKGVAPAMSDLLAGQVQLTVANIISALPYAKTGRMRGLAVTSARRVSAIPGIPTVGESGVPGYEVTSWNGWLAPAATPPEIIAKLNAELVKAAKAADIAERMATDGGEPLGTTPEQFRQHLIGEIARWRKVVQVAGISVE